MAAACAVRHHPASLSGGIARMSKVLTRKPLVEAIIRARRTAMIGAAATAIIATSPAFAATSADRATIEALPPIPGPNAVVVISNDDDITVGGDQAALGHQATEDDVDLVNTGDLTGGIGIDVSTGAYDLGNAIYDQSSGYVTGGNYAPLYDNAGNRVYYNGFPMYVPTAQFAVNARTTILARDPLASTITIENSGAIAFSGAAGIRATNPAGASIEVTNAGDITATGDDANRAGISVSTEVFRQNYTQTQTAEGDFSYNAYGQLTGVNSPDEYLFDSHLIDMEYDGGAIVVNNSGDIDMGVVAANPGYGVRGSTGIYARGDGGTTIVNSGDINVDRWSSGIHVSSTAATTIANSGDITIGNASAGISVSTSRGNAGDYRLGGDVYILNTGDIRGGITKDQAGPYDAVFATGIDVFALGSNNEYLAAAAEYNRRFTEYNEALGYEAFELYDVPNTRLYTTTVVNRGTMELGDVGRGISIVPRAGDSTAINEGTIVVGDGASIAANNFQIQSAGILQTNFPVNGLGSTISINAETGVIITGDDSAGIVNLNIGGDSIAINDGSITTGDGVSTPVTNWMGDTYDRLFQSWGIASISAAPAMGTTAYALNTGSVTVGELAIGSLVSGNGFRVLNPADPTAINVNEGIIVTGDNSTGMLTLGTNSTTFNTGSVTTGDYDISAFTPHPVYTADEFAQLRYGVASSAAVLADVVNYGTITTGDGTVGASARMTNAGYGLAARVLQNEDGLITTGDHAIGVRVSGNYEALLINEGGISVGDDSVGAELDAGSVNLRYGDTEATVIEGAVFAVNSGIIETGDSSVGIRLTGLLEDVAYSGTAVVFDPPGCSPYNPPCSYSIVDVSGTADSVGSAYLANAGTISVGAGSTAVEITGAAGNEAGLHLFNTGTIEVRGAGTAISLNAGNDIDSYAVNVGTIAGDVVFGAGDDRLVNTMYLDNFGRVVSTGNIVMTGSTIDFGAGENRFDNDRGLITFTGGDNLITGADLFMTQATIESRDGYAGSLLTIDGDLSGSFVFGADLARHSADHIVITGDVADGSSMGLVLNPTQQFRGETSFSVITVEGENGADAPLIAGVTGRFADSLLGAEASFDAATGEVLVTARFGMGHMATAAVSTTAMAQNWWSQTAGSYDKRNMHRMAGAKDTGLSVWGTAFHEEGTVEPANGLQDTSFDQKLSGLQSGIQWAIDVGDGSFSVSPMFTYGDARASLNANIGSATGDAWAYGLNASYVMGNGLYLDATWQTMTMDVDFRTPGTLSSATGSTDADADGFTFETGYPVRLASGLTFVPQLQYNYVDTELDDFSSSDGTYALSAMSGKSSLLRAGVSVFKTFETKNGSVTPVANVDYLDELDGESWLRSNGVTFANDTSGSGYRVELGLAGRYNGWDITGRVGLTDSSVLQQSLSTNVNVRYRW